MDMKLLSQRSYSQLYVLKGESGLAGRNVTALRPPSGRWQSFRALAARSDGGTQDPATAVGRILQQHKLLMESGFSYDQASLILQLTEKNTARQADGELSSCAHPSAIAEPVQAASDSNSSGTASSAAASPEPLLQQSAKSIEDRLSFLEMELLKQALTISQQQGVEPTGLPVLPAPADTAHAYDHPLPPARSRSHFAAEPGDAECWAQESEVQGSGFISHPELLDPEVLAIAQALLIRKGLPYSASAFASSSTGTSHWQQQQQRPKTSVSIWGRRHGMRQLTAKPWRYRDVDQADAVAYKSSRAPAGMQGSGLPYGYQHNHDSSLVRNRAQGRKAVGPLGDEWTNPEETDGLVPYEPNGWAVAGTLMTIYVGVLLAFFAILTSDGSVTVDAADLASMW